MFLVKVLVCVVVYYLVGLIANVVTACVVIDRLSDKTLPYPGLLTELYRKHFENFGAGKIYKKESVIKKFLITQTLWPLNVRQTIQKGKNAEKELKEYILEHDDADQRSNSSHRGLSPQQDSRDENSP